MNKVKQEPNGYKAELTWEIFPGLNLCSLSFFDSQEWRTSPAGAVMEEWSSKERWLWLLLSERYGCSGLTVCIVAGRWLWDEQFLCQSKEQDLLAGRWECKKKFTTVMALKLWATKHVWEDRTERPVDINDPRFVAVGKCHGIVSMSSHLSWLFFIPWRLSELIPLIYLKCPGKIWCTNGLSEMP